jgi:ATP-binding cassette subfamily B protein
MGFHTQNSTGKLRKVVDENIEKLEAFTAHQLPDIAGSFAAPVAALIILFAFDWRLGLAALVPLVMMYFIQSAAYGGGRAKTFIKKYQDSLEEMSNASVEYVRGISVVKAFGQTVFSFRKLYNTIKNYGDYVLQYTKAYKHSMVAFLTVLNNIYIFIMPVIILIYGGATDYAAFALAALFYLVFSMAMVEPFLKLMYVAETANQVADGIARMDAVLSAPPLKEAAEPKTADGYSVEFCGVSFSYGGIGAEQTEPETTVSGDSLSARRDKVAGLGIDGQRAESATETISDISFTAEQGEITALVGASGSGKSTIASLIPRFYDADKGAVKIGGTDVRDMSGEYLMSKVGFVFQDVFLFKQSVRDNIRAGDKNASDDDVIGAAKAARCHEFVERLPNGYDTVIGSDNIHLSGGEKQRLVIARAILKNAPILVLDEATAFADPENEQKIQEGLSELMRGKTVIIIAHRLSTVRGADKIVVLEGGRIAEIGKHDGLIAAKGVYAKMWEHYVNTLNWTIA